MGCAEYWESQGVDALDAMLTVGFWLLTRPGPGDANSGGGLFG